MSVTSVASFVRPKLAIRPARLKVAGSAEGPRCTAQRGRLDWPGSARSAAEAAPAIRANAVAPPPQPPPSPGARAGGLALRGGLLRRFQKRGAPGRGGRQGLATALPDASRGECAGKPTMRPFAAHGRHQLLAASSLAACEINKLASKRHSGWGHSSPPLHPMPAPFLQIRSPKKVLTSAPAAAACAREKRLTTRSERARTRV